MKNVRLPDIELEKLKNAFKKIFLEGDNLWVFGSRANMEKKGGDIDLFVDTSLDIKDVTRAKLNFAKELFLIFDDRKIDIVVRCKNAKNQDIYYQAINTGVQII